MISVSLLYLSCFICTLALSTVNIGGIVSLTGDKAVNGLQMKNGLLVFQQLLQQRSPILNIGNESYTLNLTIVDDKSSVDGARGAAMALLSSGTQLIVGAYSTALAAGVIDVVENKSAIPAVYIAPAASGSKIFTNTKYCFGLLHASATQMYSSMRIFSGYGAKSAVLITDSTSGLDACKLNTSEFGIISTHFLANGTADIPLALELVRLKSPSVVFICGLYPFASKVIEGARARGVNADAWQTLRMLDPPRILTDHTFQKSYVFDLTLWTEGSATDGSRSAADMSCADLSPLGCVLNSFGSYMRQLLGVEPSMEAATSFAAMEVLLQSIMLTNSTDPAVLQPIVANTPFNTVFGQVLFGRLSRQQTGTVFIRQALPTGISIVAPSLPAPGRGLVYPAPTWEEQTCISGSICGSNGVCTSSGTCECDWGFGGADCETPWAVPVITAAAILAFLLSLYTGYRVLRCRHNRRYSEEIRRNEEQQAIAETAALQAHGQTLHYAVHELSNPLFTILATLSEVESRKMSLNQGFRMMHDAVRRMQRVVEDMGASSGQGITPQTVSIKLRPVDVIAVCRDVSNRIAQMHGIKVELVAAAPLPSHIMLDALRLYQLLVHAVVLFQAAAKDTTVRMHVDFQSASQGLAVARKDSHSSSHCPKDRLPLTINTTPPAVRAIPSAGTILARPHGIAHRAKLYAQSSEEEFDEPVNGVLRISATTTPNPTSPGSCVSSPLSQQATPLVFRISPRPDAVLQASTDEHPTDCLDKNATTHSSRTHIVPIVNDQRVVVHSNTEGNREHPVQIVVQDTKTVTKRRSMPAGLERENSTGHRSINRAAATADSKLAKTASLPKNVDYSGFLGPVGCQVLARRMNGDLFLDLGTQHPSFTLTLRTQAVKLQVGADDGVIMQPSPYVTPGDTASEPSEGIGGVIHDPTADVCSNSGSGVRALIVEDEKSNARLVCRMLERAGFDTAVVFDGVDLMYRGEDSALHFDFILLDIIMPRSNGVEVAKRLRARGYARPIIAMTANTSAADIARYLEAGFDAVLGKPFSKADLEGVVLKVGIPMPHRTRVSSEATSTNAPSSNRVPAPVTAWTVPIGTDSTTPNAARVH